MNPEEIFYSLTVEDIQNVAEAFEIKINDKDLPFLIDRIGDLMGDSWYGAIEQALEELEEKQEEVNSK